MKHSILETRAYARHHPKRWLSCGATIVANRFWFYQGCSLKYVFEEPVLYTLETMVHDLFAHGLMFHLRLVCLNREPYAGWLTKNNHFIPTVWRLKIKTKILQIWYLVRVYISAPRGPFLRAWAGSLGLLYVVRFPVSAAPPSGPPPSEERKHWSCFGSQPGPGPDSLQKLKIRTKSRP